MSDVITVKDEADGIRILTLDRPPANALDDTLLLALQELATECARDDTVRSVIIAGAGSFFCGGFDLRAPARDTDATRAMVVLYRDAHRALLSLPKPTIALVQGHAIAGGFVIALACDQRVMAAGSYRLGLNETAIGASFPTAAWEIVRCRVTEPVMTELVLRAQLFGPDDAPRFGLTDALVPASHAFDVAMQRSAQLGAYPREVYANAKIRLVANALARIDAVTIDDELAISALWTTPESRAARKAQRQRL